MEDNSLDMLAKNCRLCGEPENFSSDIFSEEAKLRELPRKMETCLPIKILEENNYPNKICYRCIYKVENFYDFYNQVKKTVTQFETMLNASLVSKSVDKENINTNRLILVDKFTATEELECEICKSKLGSITQQVSNKLVDYDSDSKSHNDERLRNSFTENHSTTYTNIINEISIKKKNQKRTIDSIFNTLSTKKQKLSNDTENVVSSEATQNPTSRRKSKQPKKLTDKPIDQTCLLCDLKFESHELFVKHLYECHELEPKEIFDPKSISEVNTQYAKEISNVIRITERLKPSETRLRVKDDLSDESDTEIHNRFALPQIPVQIDLETFAEQLWAERQYFMESAQNILSNSLHQRGLYVCQICARDFHDKHSIWLHLKTIHPKHASLTCGICLQLNFSWEQLKQHMKLEHNPSKLTLAEIRKYFCVICLRQHDSKKKLLSHVYLHDFLVEAYKKNGMYFNPEWFVKTNFEGVAMDQDGGNCDKNDVESLVSDRHSNKIKNNNGFNEVLYNQLIMDENIEQDIEEISLNGDYEDNPETEPPQNKVEENDSNVQKTPRNYTLTYGCEWCSRTLSSKWERWLHVASAHAPHIETLRCSLPHCDKVFVTETFRTEHEQHHQIQGPVPNSCEVCCKLWNTRVDFYKHMMGVHPHAVPLVCGVCLKIFPTVSSLYEHVQGSHLPLQGDFVCNICGRNYSNKSKMVRHRRIHGVNESGMFIPNFMQPDGQRRIPRRVKTKEGSKTVKYPNNETPSPSIIDSKNLENNLRSSGDNSNQSLHESDSETENFETYSSASYPPSQKMESLFSIRSENFQQCKDCPNLTFANYDEFSTHRRIVHQTFHCDLCIKSYGRNSHLWKHVNRCHKGNKLITCQLCFKTSASKYHLQQHFNKIHALKADRLKYNNSPQSLESFLDKKFDGYSFESVKQSFLRQELLEKEQLKYQNDATKFSENIMESKPDIYPKEPPQEIDINSELYTSIITNYNPPTVAGPYKCLKCNKGFTKRYLLKKHKKNCRPRLQKDLLTRCKSCERIFKDRQSLQKHLANYHSEFKCHLCMLTFPSKCEIISHIRFTHPNHVDFVCECGQILRSKEDLQMHKGDHRNSHICQFCGDSLLTKMKLKMHILSLHRKILSLSCGICLKLFATQHVLRDHVKLVHFRDTKFGNCCPVCGKKYGSKWKCFDHINKSHGKIFKPCKICLSVFENEIQLRDHFCAVHLGAGEMPNLPQQIEEKPSINNNEYQSSDNEDDEQSDSSLNLPTIPKITLASNKSQPENYSIVNKTDWLSQFPDMTSTPMRTPSHQAKRTVYENSDAPSMCEICLKTWPAKKHLWQHYIRCHKGDAATICGICLKTHKTYLDLRKHLHEKHPNLLHGRGFSSNFICKICGRYHNASSKLKLHMAIHVNYNLTDDYDYNEIKQEIKEQPIDQPMSDSEMEEEEFKPMPQHKDSDVENESMFIGFSLQQRKNSENYYRNYSSLLDCFQIMETSPPKTLVCDLDESDVELIKSDDNSDCDSEDERRKLLLKMSPISHKSSHSIDDPTRDYSDFDDDELQIDEQRSNDQPSPEPSVADNEDEPRTSSKLTNDSEYSNSYYEGEGTTTFKDDNDDDDTSGDSSDEKEVEKPTFEVDSTNNIFVLKYDDGREVRYENLNMEYEIVNEEEGARDDDEHEGETDAEEEFDADEDVEEIQYEEEEQIEESSAIENAIKSIHNASDLDATNTSEHAYEEYEHTEVVEQDDDLMLEEEVVTEDVSEIEMAIESIL